MLGRVRVRCTARQAGFSMLMGMVFYPVLELVIRVSMLSWCLRRELYIFSREVQNLTLKKFQNLRLWTIYGIFFERTCKLVVEVLSDAAGTRFMSICFNMGRLVSSDNMCLKIYLSY